MLDARILEVFVDGIDGGAGDAERGLDALVFQNWTTISATFMTL